MAAPFKIPRKKDSPDPAHVHVQSPLSRLHSPDTSLKGYESQAVRGDRRHAGKGGSSSDTGRTLRQPPFDDFVKSILGLNGTDGGRAAAANHRSAEGPGGRAQSSFSNGWRPKRASDRLLPAASPERKPSTPSGARTNRAVSVDAVDSLAELRSAEHAGRKQDAALEENSSEDDFVTPPKPSSSSSVSTVTGGVGGLLLEDVRERQRARWMEFREKKGKRSQSAVPKRKRKTSEPIVLSSEDEDKDTATPSRAQRSSKALKASSSAAAAPTFLNLDFLSLHIGSTDADANGAMMISDSGITIPLKGPEEAEEVEVTVVASQLCGYGVWDGGVVRDRPLLAAWKGPAPSLLFLWVTDAQASLLQRELVSAWSDGAAGSPPCRFLLLVLTEQLTELQAALLASVLDMAEYRQGRASSSSSGGGGGPDSPLDWAAGLLLLHSSPSPVDRRLLALLGHSASETTGSGRKTRSTLQTLPTRLIQYPKAPCKGRITVTQEDLVCLDEGEFLNDVIIDFYLKFLLLEGVGGAVAERSHVFSSFLYKQLSRDRGPGEDDVSSVPDRRVRHQRVKTWTRNVDIFSKDFLFVPVNQAAHWFLAVVCFPGLQECRYEDFDRPAGRSNGAWESLGVRAQQPPACTLQGCTRDRVLKRSCILVMDSLKLSYHRTVCKLLRDYLQEEWDVRRRTPRLFTEETMRSCSCRVPLQDNSSDCGVYLLQYTHSFLQNPVVHFDLPLRLDGWFPQQSVRQKRDEIRSLILRLQEAPDRK